MVENMSFEVDNLSFSYGRHKVLSDISFSVEQGEVFCIIGANGVGKTTLFKCMLGLQSNYAGEIRVNGRAVKNMKPRELAQSVAYIPQSQGSSFGYSVLDMVMMGTTASMRIFSSPGSKERELAFEALQNVGLGSLASRNYLEISSGERQLVLVARALAQNAGVLIMDEPTSNLDYGNQLRVMEKMCGLAGFGYTIIMSIHNPEQAFMFADRVMALQNGTVAACGSPQEVITSDTIKRLYGVDVEIESISGGKMISCVPEYIAEAIR